MKWLGKIIRKLIESSYNNETEKVSKLVVSANNELISHSAYNIAVFHAIGGKVIEFRRYDRKTDKSDTQVYVISDETEFADRLAKIIAMENMK